MKPKRFFKRLLFYLLLIMTVVVVSGGVSVYLYKDRIIQHFVRELNSQLNTPVHVDRFDANIFDNFPYVAITLHNVVVEESYSWSNDTLLSAKKITLSLNPIEVLQGNYVVHNMRVDIGSANFKTNWQGENNYAIFKKAEKGSPAVFDINGITLIKVNFYYQNLESNKILDLYSEHLKSSVRSFGEIIEMKGQGEVTSYSIGINHSNYLEDTEFSTNVNLLYNIKSKLVDIKPSLVISNQSEFIVEGKYSLQSGEIDIAITNDNTTIQTLIGLLPTRHRANLSKYKSKGKGHLELKLKGISNGSNSPAIDLQFGLFNTNIFHPDYNTQVDSVELKGRYISDELNDLAKGKLTLTGVSGKMGGKQFLGNLEIVNLKTSTIKADFSGQVDLNSLLNFYPSHKIEKAAGSIILNVSIDGKVSDLKKRATIGKVTTAGEINLVDVNFQIKDQALAYSELNGLLLFNNNDLAIADLSGNYGNSDFLINGYFKNFVSYVLLKNQPIGIEADLQSQLIDLDELLSNQSELSSSDDGQYTFSINPDLYLKFNCSINQLKFRRFLGNSIKGNLSVKKQVASSNNISMQTMDGNLRLSGSVDATTANIKVFTDAELKEIAIDQAFHVFENFNQSFLVATHLKGKVDANVKASMVFKDNLDIYPETLTSDIGISIANGELNNFEPMQRLSKYLDEHELSALKFSKLNNDIHIENKTIYLPEMEVHSNVSNIKIGGTHTFDQNIAYSVVAPLNNKKRKDRDELFGAIEEDKSGQAKIFLKITGTTSEYEVSYDKRAVKKEIISDLKREVQELKEAFQTKGKKEKKEVELEDDDYFDWD